MQKITVILSGILAIFPCIMYLDDLRYRIDPALERSVCRNIACSDDLLLDSADRLAGSNQQDNAIALANLQEALRRNVSSPDRWCDFGEALLRLGRIEESRYSFARAVKLGPQSLSVFWRTAQFYTRIQEPRRSEEYLGRMLALAPKYEELVFSTYLSGRREVSDTLEYGVPRALAQDYFRYLLTHDASLENINQAWAWLQSHSQIDGRLACSYVDFLSNKRDYSLAAEIWDGSAGRYDDAYLKPNLVFNGSFESEPFQCGFDWRFSEPHGVQIARDSTEGFSGSSSLLIVFKGESNIDFKSVAHDVVAGPGNYHFRAWIRTSGLTTDQGVGFSLVDSSSQLNLQTMRLTGTHDWTPIALDFTLSGPVRLLRIEVVRQSSWKFDNRIAGKVWIDGVSLVR
jgi:hypothetical protein